MPCVCVCVCVESVKSDLIVCKTAAVTRHAGALPVSLKFRDSVVELDERFVYMQNPGVSDVRPLKAFRRYAVVLAS